MTTITASAPLNAEPSRPEERRNQHLEAKSYVEAVQQGSDETSERTTNGTINDQEADAVPPDEHAGMTAGKAVQRPSILRIVNTHNEVETPALGQNKKQNDDPNTASLNGESKVMASKQGDEVDHTERPGVERNEFKQEHSATVGALSIAATQDDLG